MDEKESAEMQELQKKIRQVERELLEKHPEWMPSKANWIAKRMLCLIN